MMVVVFRSRMRDDVNESHVGEVGERMYALASQMPGFVSYKDFTAADGETLTLVEFASEAELLAWREHPEHREVQELGRREFFAEYRIQVCEPKHAYRFNMEEGRVEPM